MIDLKNAAEIVDEISEIGMEIAGQTLPIDVRGGHGVVNVMFEHVLWCSEDGSDWTLERDIEVETPAQLREALIGELENFVKFLSDVLTVAKLRS